MVILNLREQPQLIQAIFGGGYDDVLNVLSCKPDVNNQDAEKRSALHAAAYKGDAQVVAMLLQCGAKANVRDNQWLTPLHRACYTGSEETVSVLLQYKADVTVRDRQWQIPLHIAAANHAVECVSLLLDCNPNVNVTDRSGRTAMHHAALNGHLDVLEVLLQRGGIVNACDKKDCRPLHYAAHFGHVEAMELLIRHGADVNSLDRNQYSPLHVAAASGMVSACRILLNSTATLTDIQNAYGNTALHLACLAGHLPVCQELIAYGADPAALNYRGETPLHCASASAQGVACLGHLLSGQQGVSDRVDINRASCDGRTALHMSAIHGRFTRSKTLIDNGAIVDSTDKNGCTALHIAAQFGHGTLTNTLISYGADISKKGYEGRTPLHMSCLSDFIECCRKLLQAGADLNCEDETGKTPTHCAAYKGSVECLDLLVSKGADFKRQDKMGQTALHYAAAQGHFNCVFALVGIGSVVNVADNDGCMPLHLAAAYDMKGRCVEYFLQHKGDPTIPDNNGFTAIHYAVAGGNFASLNYLLDAVGPNFSFVGPNMPLTTPLHLAARSGNVDMLRLILPYFTDTNVRCAQGRTPLLLAAREGHAQCVQMLLRYGARVAYPYVDTVAQMSAVHHSARNGHVHCLALLVDNTEDRRVIDEKDKYERTALMLAVSGGHPYCVATLLKADSDPNIVDNDRHSSLFRAVVSGQNSIVQFLILKNAQVANSDCNGKTVLHLAAACGHFACLQTLVEHMTEDEVALFDNQRFSALHWACYNGNAKCVEFLLKGNNYDQLSKIFEQGNPFSPAHCATFSGSEASLELLYKQYGPEIVSLCDTRNRTPLHIACLHGHVDCVRYLVTQGAAIDVKDDDGRTPLIAAAQNGQSHIIDLLKTYNADVTSYDNNGNTALHLACLKKHSMCALLLLDLIEDTEIINMVNNSRETPLHLSARNGLVDVTRELIKKGSSVLAVDNNGLTPALCCAPNLHVAQCLSIILASHPVQTPTDENSHTNKDNKIPPNPHYRFLIDQLLPPVKLPNYKSVQTEMSLLRSTRECLIDLFETAEEKLRENTFENPQKSPTISNKLPVSNITRRTRRSGNKRNSSNNNNRASFYQRKMPSYGTISLSTESSRNLDASLRKCETRKKSEASLGESEESTDAGGPSCFIIEAYDNDDNSLELHADGTGFQLHRSLSNMSLGLAINADEDTNNDVIDNVNAGVKANVNANANADVNDNFNNDVNDDNDKSGFSKNPPIPVDLQPGEIRPKTASERYFLQKYREDITAFDDTRDWISSEPFGLFDEGDELSEVTAGQIDGDDDDDDDKITLFDDRPELLGDRPALLGDKRTLFDDKRTLFDDKRTLLDEQRALFDEKIALTVDEEKVLNVSCSFDVFEDVVMEEEWKRSFEEFLDSVDEREEDELEESLEDVSDDSLEEGKVKVFVGGEDYFDGGGKEDDSSGRNVVEGLKKVGCLEEKVVIEEIVVEDKLNSKNVGDKQNNEVSVKEKDEDSVEQNNEVAINQNIKIANNQTIKIAKNQNITIVNDGKIDNDDKIDNCDVKIDMEQQNRKIVIGNTKDIEIVQTKDKEIVETKEIQKVEPVKAEKFTKVNFEDQAIIIREEPREKMKNPMTELKNPKIESSVKKIEDLVKANPFLKCFVDSSEINLTRNSEVIDEDLKEIAIKSKETLEESSGAFPLPENVLKCTEYVLEYSTTTKTPEVGNIIVLGNSCIEKVVDSTKNDGTQKQIQKQSDATIDCLDLESTIYGNKEKQLINADEKQNSTIVTIEKVTQNSENITHENLDHIVNSAENLYDSLCKSHEAAETATIIHKSTPYKHVENYEDVYTKVLKKNYSNNHNASSEMATMGDFVDTLNLDFPADQILPAATPAVTPPPPLSVNFDNGSCKKCCDSICTSCVNENMFDSVDSVRVAAEYYYPDVESSDDGEHVLKSEELISKNYLKDNRTQKVKKRERKFVTVRKRANDLVVKKPVMVETDVAKKSLTQEIVVAKNLLTEETVFVKKPLILETDAAKKLLTEETVVAKQSLREETVVAKNQPLTEETIVAKKQPLTEETIVAKKQPLTEETIVAKKQPLTEETIVAKKQPLTLETVAKKQPLTLETVVACGKYPKQYPSFIAIPGINTLSNFSNLQLKAAKNLSSQNIYLATTNSPLKLPDFKGRNDDSISEKNDETIEEIDETIEEIHKNVEEIHEDCEPIIKIEDTCLPIARLDSNNNNDSKNNNNSDSNIISDNNKSVNDDLNKSISDDVTTKSVTSVYKSVNIITIDSKESEESLENIIRLECQPISNNVPTHLDILNPEDIDSLSKAVLQNAVTVTANGSSASDENLQLPELDGDSNSVVSNSSKLSRYRKKSNSNNCNMS